MKFIRTMAFFVIFPSLLLGHVPEKIPLEQAVAEGLKKDYNYLNTVLDQERAELQRQLSEKNKLFRFAFEGNYLYRSETMVIDFPSTQIPGGAVIPGREVVAGVHHNFDLKFSLTQPLFTGGILTNSIRMEEVQEAVQANQRALKENEIAGLIKSSYFQYLLLIRKRESLSALSKTLDLHRKRISNLLDEGLARKTDLLETLSQIEELRLSINDLEQAIESERILFRRLCGYDPEEIDETYKEKPITQNEALSQFEQIHPVLKSLRNRMDMLSLQRKIAGGKYLPQVSGFAEAHYGKPGIDYFAKKWSLYLQGGVTIKIPVFDWNRLGSEKTLIDIQKQKLENQRNQFVRDVTTSLQQLFSLLHKLEERRSHIDQLIALSEEDAVLKEELYEERQIPNVDYLAALLTKEKNVLARDEIRIQMEEIKVSINTLIGRNKESI
jgi:outer membrane protein TolC